MLGMNGKSKEVISLKVPPGYWSGLMDVNEGIDSIFIFISSKALLWLLACSWTGP
jgi:hypothetical protein